MTSVFLYGSFSFDIVRIGVVVIDYEELCCCEKPRSMEALAKKCSEMDNTKTEDGTIPRSSLNLAA